jgi:Ankyrin repeats (many copies)
MTSNHTQDDADKELLERYRRAGDKQGAAPSEAVRAAILAEAHRAAEQRAEDARGPRGRPFDSSQPAANDSRWKLPAFGTAGAALVAALLFAPRLWENAPPPVSGAVVASSQKAAPAPPAAASADSRARSSDALQEVIVTPRENPAQSAKPTAPAAPAASLPRAAPGVQPQLDALARPEAPAEKAAPPEFAAAPSPQPPIAASTAARAAFAGRPAQTAPLQSAAAAGDIVRTTALLDEGTPLNERDELGRTPLMLAVVQSRLDVVRLLLDRGADPNIADNAGRTPLQHAKQANSAEIAAMLERAGAR